MEHYGIIANRIVDVLNFKRCFVNIMHDLIFQTYPERFVCSFRNTKCSWTFLWNIFGNTQNHIPNVPTTKRNLFSWRRCGYMMLLQTPRNILYWRMSFLILEHAHTGFYKLSYVKQRDCSVLQNTFCTS